MSDESGCKDAGVDAKRSEYDINDNRLSAFDDPTVIPDADATGDGGCDKLRGMAERDPGFDAGDWDCEGPDNDVGGCSRVVVVGLEPSEDATE